MIRSIAPAVLTFLLTSVCAPSVAAQTNPGDRAPDIEFKASFNTTAKNLAGYHGKVVMLDLFATW